MWWWKFSRDLWFAQFEAQSVIGLRMMKLALAGPGALRDTDRMVDEKVAASVDAVMTLGRGGSPKKRLDDAREVMRANIDRLSKQ